MKKINDIAQCSYRHWFTFLYILLKYPMPATLRNYQNYHDYDKKINKKLSARLAVWIMYMHHRLTCSKEEEENPFKCIPDTNYIWFMH